MEPAVTRKSAWRRLLQSWWILLTFTLLFNWIPFLYIAGRTRNKRWAIWGLVYAIPFMLTMADMFPDGSAADDNVSTAVLIGCLISMIHAFSIRKEFLLRLEARQLSARGEDEALIRKIEAEYGVRMRKSAPPAGARSPVPPPIPPVPPSASGVLDLNAAAEEEIADLPGVGLILAKKAIQVREANGGFRSTEQFFEALGLKPHAIERIRPLVAVRDAASPPPPSHGRRVVDY